MKYLKSFENHTGYETFTQSDEFIRPNVSHCVQENEVHYNSRTWADEYLTIESLEDNNTIYLKASSRTFTRTISASTDNGETWTGYTSSTGGSGITLATLNKGDRLLIKGENSTYGTSSNYNRFNSTGQFEVKGNIMSLVSGDSFANADEITGTYTFNKLFYQRTGLTSTENLILPATALTLSCYNSMFYGCTSLTVAPELPATTLASQCYNNMFYGCTSLTVAPELPATTLAESCYEEMFNGCTSLTTAPELPATTLADNCYFHMFYGCTSLTKAPELPATTLADYCYLEMFYDCTNLNYIKAMFTTTPSTTYTANWAYGVASSGTFVKNAAAQWDVTGVNGIPTGWTVETATA